MSKFLYFDLETTGLTDLHAVVEIAGIIEIDGVVKEEFDFYMKPFKGDMVSPKALSITNMTMEEISNFEDPIVVKNKIMKTLSKYVDKFDKNDKFTLIGHNILAFDFPRLLSWFKKCDEKYLGSVVNYKEKIDTLASYYLLVSTGKMKKQESYALGYLCEEHGIDLKNAHNALADIRANRQLYKVLEGVICK